MTELSATELGDMVFGTYSENWEGKQVQDRGDKYHFEVEVLKGRNKLTVRYHRQGARSRADRDELELTFDIDKAIQEEVKITLYCVNGEGQYTASSEQRNKPAINPSSQLSNQEMVCFVTGTQMVFGIDIPHVMLQDCNLQKRKLRRPLTAEEMSVRK
ncbi:hypothetical protein QOT17_003948 [Balamuthia mandrillaris]